MFNLDSNSREQDEREGERGFKTYVRAVEGFNKVKFLVDCFLGIFGPDELETEIDQDSEDWIDERVISCVMECSQKFRLTSPVVGREIELVGLEHPVIYPFPGFYRQWLPEHIRSDGQRESL